MGKSQSKTPITGVLKDAKCSCFALVGFGGCGKSAFVNAVRGIPDDDQRAARVDIVETREGPIEYTYPSHPLVSFCDLPGYGTPSYPDIESYWRAFELGKFDIFLIFISLKLTELDRTIIQKVKSENKSFFLIHAKIDNDVECMVRKHGDRYTEEELLNKIKNYLIKGTCHLPCTEEDIFLINNYDPYKGDFFRLIEAIMNKFPSQEDTSSYPIEHYLSDARKYIQENGVSGIEEFFRKKLEGSKAVRIRFGITGGGGTGKSAFINAIRGLEDDDENAANVGVTETTSEPKEYEHPENPKVTFVDLPGIDSPKFPDLQTYYEEVGFENYDTFLILTATRFTQNDSELARKVKAMGKSFFFVRSKVDDDYMSNKRKNAINEAEYLKDTKEKIWKNGMDCLKGLISSEEEIYLISNYDKDKWDFDRLIEAINKKLPVLQRECLTLSLSNITRECLKRKTEIFKAQAFAVAAVSAATSVVPVPGLANVIDLVLVGSIIAAYYKQFGLENQTQEEMDILDAKYKEIIKRYQSEATMEFAFNAATKTLLLKIGIEEVSKFIPIIGIVVAGSISFATTLRYLLTSINELEEVALIVWEHKKRLIQEESNTAVDGNSSHTQ